MSKKLVQVLMLPANNPLALGDLIVEPKKGLSIHQVGVSVDSSSKPQHLYFTSNEENKEVDWVYKSNAKPNIYKHKPTTNPWYIDEVKIIATTDKSLGLPLIPQSFVEEYVAKNGKIKECYVFGHRLEGPTNGPILDIVNIVTPENAPSMFPKQTVEEAADNYMWTYFRDYCLTGLEADRTGFKYTVKGLEIYNVFIAGVKWAQENK